MKYELKVSGMKKLNDLLGQLDEKAPGVAAKALYQGAGVMADEVESFAKSIVTAPFRYAARGRTRLPSPEEKQIVVNAGAGIAKFEHDGADVNTSVGYKASGYAPLAGKMKPVPLIVNAISSGTSFMGKQPFIRKAARAGGKKATAAMEGFIENALNEMTK